MRFVPVLGAAVLTLTAAMIVVPRGDAHAAPRAGAATVKYRPDLNFVPFSNVLLVREGGKWGVQVDGGTNSRQCLLVSTDRSLVFALHEKILTNLGHAMTIDCSKGTVGPIVSTIDLDGSVGFSLGALAP